MRPGRITSLDTDPPQEDPTQTAVGLEPDRLRAVVEAHPGASADLADARRLEELDVELEDRLERPKTRVVGGVDRDPAAAFGAECLVRESIRRAGNLPLDAGREGPAEFSAEPHFHALGAVAHECDVGLAQHTRTVSSVAPAT